MALVMTAQEMAKRRFNSGVREIGAVYHGDQKDGFRGQEVQGTSQVVGMGSERYVGTEGYNKIWNQISDILGRAKRNAAQVPDDLYSLINLIRMDLTRRRMQEQDYTDMLDIVDTNPAFGKSVALDEFLPYTAPFAEIRGSNDTVPLIEQKSGATGNVSMAMYAVGWKMSISDMLYNTLFDLQRVMDAVTRGYVGKRNDLSLGSIIGATFDASQKQAADATASATYDLLLYNTFRKAYKLLTSLKDPQTNQEIRAPRVVLVCHPTLVWSIERVIRGQLQAKGGTPINTESLPIDEIWPYRGDVLYWGKETVTYSGCPTTKAYLLVPGVASHTLVKRGLTMNVGQGDVLSLAQEERAWYFVQGRYDTDFMGKTGGAAASTGFVVEVTLPADA